MSAHPSEHGASHDSHGGHHSPWFYAGIALFLGILTLVELGPLFAFYNLPATGESATLHTHLVVREDAHVLYGFATLEERAAFRKLIRISGVGARTALSVLSGLSVADLAQAVALQDTARLTKVPGIGKKTAERLLLELKGKLVDTLPAGTRPEGGNDVLNALLGLGYSEKEALAAVKNLPAGLAVTEGIRAALKALAKS